MHPMDKQRKTSRPGNGSVRFEKKLPRSLILIPLTALVIRLITSVNTPAGGWAGADGENYLSGVDAFLSEGFFSGESVLTYWPAGYPLLIWPLAALSLTKFLYMLSFLQSLFFAFATYYITRSISKTSLSYLAIAASLFLSFNPTLSLGSLVIGYETPVASCLMMALGVSIRMLVNPKEKPEILKSFVFIGLWFGLASFMQPRYLLVGLTFIFLHSLFMFGKKLNVWLLAIGLICMLLLPSLLVFRNFQAVGKTTISTNLGVTMNLGVGEETLGGYKRIGPAIDCKPQSPATSVSENDLVACVVKWYATNPMKTLKLAFNKSLYYWSPWSGPVAEGTMARNPWLKISPIEIMEQTNSGTRVIEGGFGKLVSYSWLTAQISLFIWGFVNLLRKGRLEAQVAVLALSPVALSWLITLGTIGDHRFRIPTMGLSLLLQVAGILAIRKRVTKVLQRR